jgi:uncharacterized protein YecE (DUF72 family)
MGWSKVDEPVRSALPIRVGCAGWGISRLTEYLFPPGPSHLARYAQVFHCCEINSSFYRSHKLATWQRWANSVPAHFRFSVKIPRSITHDMRLECTSTEIRPFIQQVGALREKLGPLLLQLPPSLAFMKRTAVVFFETLRNEFQGDIVCEPRHLTWFTKTVDEVLSRFQIARVAADPACTLAARRPGGATRIAYFRLHGSPRMYFSSYADCFLSDLSNEVRSVTCGGSVWCIFDNTAAGAAAQNALQLASMLR